jgi:hypothetical protein
MWLNQLDLAGVGKVLEQIFKLSKRGWALFPSEACLMGCAAMSNMTTHCQAMLYLVTSSDHGLQPENAAEKQEWHQVRQA